MYERPILYIVVPCYNEQEVLPYEAAVLSLFPSTLALKLCNVVFLVGANYCFTELEGFTCPKRRRWAVAFGNKAKRQR